MGARVPAGMLYSGFALEVGIVHAVRQTCKCSNETRCCLSGIALGRDGMEPCRDWPDAGGGVVWLRAINAGPRRMLACCCTAFPAFEGIRDDRSA